MKPSIRILSAFLSLALLTGCAAHFLPLSPAEPQSPAAQPEPVTANELVLRALDSECARAPGSSVILSPLSIEMALGMAANGADGEARQALKTLLGADAETLNALLGACLQGEGGPLSMANSMWFNEALEGRVREDFKDTLASAYQAGAGSFTPGSAADAARINGWVKEKTGGRIDAVLTPSALTEDTLALLVNALYFNGKWVVPFRDAQVSDGKFKTAGGEEQESRLMSGTVETYFETDWATGFAKRYEGGYEFIGILPREEGPAELSQWDLDAFLSSRTGDYDVDVRIPKFELTYTTSLKPTLTALGLGSLFRDHALDALLTDEALAEGWTAGVSDVLHKTYMKMYEEGTEAAAVTGVIAYGATSAMTEPRERRQVFLDRPFVFLIRDSQRDQVVFCGAVNGLK